VEVITLSFCITRESKNTSFSSAYITTPYVAFAFIRTVAGLLAYYHVISLIKAKVSLS